MKKFLLLSARRIGVPGLLTWVMLIGIYLWVRVPRGDWYWSDLAKYTAMVLVLSYVLGSMKTKDLPYVLCTSCGKRNRDTGTENLHGWACGYCKEETLVRVGAHKEAA